MTKCQSRSTAILPKSGLKIRETCQKILGGAIKLHPKG
uniref:Uncharacterized protein n=1 Tax=Siphoviridae sp. ctTBR23 TaxID=2825515 RepID=A0A8S5NZA7_9CAUD|nr:MAG TPA: hypothetical protein [Siphoviridae sp. ctTBR23]DAR27042.1 MAG TPA: hypothetical protein [Caudoviricetes sp.]